MDGRDPILLLGAGASITSGIPAAGTTVEKVARWAWCKENGRHPDDFTIRRSDYWPWVSGLPWFRANTSLADLYPEAIDNLLGVKSDRRDFFEKLINPNVPPPEQRRLRLVGAVRPPQPLDRGVGLPAGFEQIVDAQPAVPRGQFGVVTAPGAASLRKDQDALQVIHEGGGLGEVGGGRAVLDDEAVTLAHHAARASGHFGDEVCAEALDDLVERAGNAPYLCPPQFVVVSES
jgi:hypothetical protein